MTMTEQTGTITDPRLLFAGQAIFTVQSKTGEHFTYRIASPRFVKILYKDEAKRDADLEIIREKTKTAPRTLDARELWSDACAYGIEVGLRSHEDTADLTSPDEVDLPVFVGVLKEGHGGNADNRYAYASLGLWENNGLRSTRKSIRVKGKWHGQWVNWLDWNTVCHMKKDADAPDVPKSIQVLLWAIDRMQAHDGELPDGYRVFHLGRCLRCGRDLTDPESVQRGIGPECARRV